MDESFNLHKTVEAVGQAYYAVICHICFDAGLHGVAMALLLALVGFINGKRGGRFGKPLISVARRFGLFSLALTVPGFIVLVLKGQLPATGVYNVNSFGFIGFWSLVLSFLCADEMNYQWFQRKTSEQ
jgi:hypothetical protein